MERILIIGGTGNIGYPLIEMLANREDIELIAGVRDVAKSQSKFTDFKNVKLVSF
ncbi:hypothetical protein NBRC111893_1986 [Lentilactobacillus kosonis]|uniref:Uncharacterized protein n=1 Tax=Lentilactobacillus kosonis TaxID=2810561 RepID=A0A401FN81_9LACO|nr:hypothetical protein NBRC111893_1986 [Lentilactobacillus kosonis]